MIQIIGPPGGDDDRGSGSEDATQIVPPTPASSDEEATRILPMRHGPRPAGQGQVIGVAAQQSKPSSGTPSTPSGSAPSTPANTAPAAPPAPEDTDAESRTVFAPVGFSPRQPSAAVAAAAAGETAEPEEFDPAVGWLVVVEGPGRGKHCAVYYGQNGIGRGPEQRIRLNFGDNRIARDTHAFVIYDDVARAFYLRDNGKTNLVRLNGAPVMTPMPLKDRDRITIGSTVMLFVALCGSQFDWLAGDEPQTKPRSES